MGRYIGIPFLVMAAILNTTLLAELRIGGGSPDLVFLLVISWALLSDLREGLLWAVVGGVLQDWLSVAPLGTSALGLVIVVFAANAVFGQIARGNLLVPPVVVLVGTVVYQVVVLAVLRFANYSPPILAALAYVVFPAAIWNLLLILPVFRLVGALHAAFQPRRVRLE